MRGTTFPILFGLLLSGCVPADLETPSATPTASPAVDAITTSAIDSDNPVIALPTNPRGITGDLTRLPAAPTPKSVRLGRWLFHDKRLSIDNSISCASCHQSAAALSNTSDVSTGVGGQLGTRKAPPILNLAFATQAFFFWDGRATSLEAQAAGPIVNPVEMGMTADSVVSKLQGIAGYPTYFSEAFGTSTVSMTLITRAIADYEKTRFSGDSAFDLGTLSTQAVRGRQVFNASGCAGCHGGQLFSDFGFHNTGVAWDPATSTFTDIGRSNGRFKTPTLRNLTARAPYMHDGSVATLRDVVLFYNQGGVANPQLDNRMRPLNLSSGDIDALVAFLQSLDGTGFADEGPSVFPD